MASNIQENINVTSQEVVTKSIAMDSQLALIPDTSPNFTYTESNQPQKNYNCFTCGFNTSNRFAFSSHYNTRGHKSMLPEEIEDDDDFNTHIKKEKSSKKRKRSESNSQLDEDSKQLEKKKKKAKSDYAIRKINHIIVNGALPAKKVRKSKKNIYNLKRNPKPHGHVVFLVTREQKLN